VLQEEYLCIQTGQNRITDFSDADWHVVLTGGLLHGIVSL